jgi:hypothetical protein
MSDIFPRFEQCFHTDEMVSQQDMHGSENHIPWSLKTKMIIIKALTHELAHFHTHPKPNMNAADNILVVRICALLTRHSRALRGVRNLFMSRIPKLRGVPEVVQNIVHFTEVLQRPITRAEVERFIDGLELWRKL